jgi:hypothetical protein
MERAVVNPSADKGELPAVYESGLSVHIVPAFGITLIVVKGAVYFGVDHIVSRAGSDRALHLYHILLFRGGTAVCINSTSSFIIQGKRFRAPIAPPASAVSAPDPASAPFFFKAPHNGIVDIGAALLHLCHYFGGRFAFSAETPDRDPHTRGASSSLKR